MLVVDDNMMNQRIIRKILESLGYFDSVVVSNGKVRARYTHAYLKHIHTHAYLSTCRHACIHAHTLKLMHKKTHHHIHAHIPLVCALSLPR